MRLVTVFVVFISCMNMLPVNAQQPLNVMSFNIRYNNTSDSLNSWPYRKDIAASQVKFFDVDVLGVQEALYDQMLDLQQRLPGYKYEGVGRDDGKTKGEYSAIFYNTTRLKFLNGSTFWLSEHPDAVGVKGWDAVLPRIVTWCAFEDKINHKKFFAFNTHFDHIGKIARAESAKLLLRKVKEIAGDNPVVVTGDFNAGDEDAPINIITDKNNAGHLTDSKFISLQPHYGPDGTFNAFKSKEVSNEAIDHIFIKNNFKVLKHGTISESWNGRFSSDHFPVLAQISFE